MNELATAADPNSRKQLGQIMVESGLLNYELLEAVLALQGERGGRLGQLLVQLGFASEDAVAMALANQLNLPPVQLEKVRIRRDALQALSPELVEQYRVLPIELSRARRQLRVATADPTDEDALNELSFHTQLDISFLVTGADALGRAIRRYYGAVVPSQSTQVNLAYKQSAVSARKLLRMSNQVQVLERRLEEQSLLMRGMLDLLCKKGTLQRGELRERLFGAPGRPPPMPLPSAANGRLRRAPRDRMVPLLPDL
jgi:type IV pilus assembly protein PilB